MDGGGGRRVGLPWEGAQCVADFLMKGFLRFEELAVSEKLEHPLD